MTDHTQRAQRMARDAAPDEAPTAWFDRLYEAAEAGTATIPWDRGHANPYVTDWFAGADGAGRRTLVVGCGLGDDAEDIAGRGYAVTAFDVSAAAVRACRRRYPESAVDYRVADLLDPPPDWYRAWDVVVESLTVQSLPPSVRATATRNLASFVAPGGTLLVMSGVLPDGAGPEGPPWRLSRADIEAFATDGLTATDIAFLPGDDADRWRASFSRAA